MKRLFMRLPDRYNLLFWLAVAGLAYGLFLFSEGLAWIVTSLIVGTVAFIRGN
jgi:hypothetical protein